MTKVLEIFKTELFDAFGETFEQVQGIYLDRGTSLFETLATISAETASRPVSATCASIATQVEHINFYLNVLEDHMLEKPRASVNWKEIWQNPQPVTPEQWAASQQKLKASYQSVMTTMQNFDSWEGENDISGALAILVHTAYHLGEIRQALCFVNQP